MTSAATITVHEDPDLFREAITFTAAETGFTPRLIEKDYFCTLLLQHLAPVENVIFKGGTCLAKVHAAFCRLSEDLDFAMSLPVDAHKSVRSAHARGLRRAVGMMPPPFTNVQAVAGHNNCSQYNGAVNYVSLLDSHLERINIELSLREPLVVPSTVGAARTLLLDPISGSSMAGTIPVVVIAREEAFAEKFRAALTRREVAIRDFFDLDYAARRLRMPMHGQELVRMVKHKVAVLKDDAVQIGPERLRQLRQQVDAQLRPVLRPADFAGFDLERAFEMVVRMAALITQ